MDTIDYGKRIKLFRKLAKLSPKELAEQADLDITTIYKIESNTAKPSIDSLERICSVLNISMAYFFSYDCNVDIPAQVKTVVEDIDFLNIWTECIQRPELKTLLAESVSASKQIIISTTIIIKALKEGEHKTK